MRTFYNKMAVLSVLGLLLTACGTSSDVVSGHLISKRKVNKGFFINHSKQPKSGQTDEQEARQPFIQYSGETELAYAEDKETVQQQEVSDAAPNADFIVNDRIADPEETASITTPAISTQEVQEKTPAPQNMKQDRSNKAEFHKAKKEVKKELREDGIRLLIMVLLCLILPPLAVYLHEGSWNTTCWLNLLLTILGWLPGQIHALIVILMD